MNRQCHGQVERIAVFAHDFNASSERNESLQNVEKYFRLMDCVKQRGRIHELNKCNMSRRDFQAGEELSNIARLCLVSQIRHMHNVRHVDYCDGLKVNVTNRAHLSTFVFTKDANERTQVSAIQ